MQDNRKESFITHLPFCNPRKHSVERDDLCLGERQVSTGLCLLPHWLATVKPSTTQYPLTQISTTPQLTWSPGLQLHWVNSAASDC
jgi:hypothetical protein